MADSADTAVRAVSTAITTPVKKVSGLAAAVSHGASAFRARRDAGEAMRVAKEAAAKRERELDEELRNAGKAEPEGPPPAA
jgi:Sec-independent protein translocase protein TatA